MSIAERVAASALPIAVLAALLVACATPPAQPASRDVVALGRPAGAGEVAAQAQSIFPDGRGLPPGSGDAIRGEVVYARACERCHGERGRGGSGGNLAGRGPLTGADADRTVGSYWPYATTVFDYIRRAMPMDAPRSLADDDVYAVTAYLLFLNRIVDHDSVLDRDSLPRIRMPNADGFVGIDAPWPR